MDRVSKETRSRIMSRIRGRDTAMERAVRPVLEALGFTYHPEDGFLEGAPDFVHLTKHVAVFLDGCFFHGCLRHYREPKTNVQFWRDKLARNTKRDREITAKYEAMGWTVIRVWEHDLRELVKRLNKTENLGRAK